MIDNTVKKETITMVLGHIILSAIMELVFLVCGQYNYTVTLGNILGSGVAVLSYFLLGVTVQKAVNKSSEDAAKMMKLSQSLRFIMILAVIVAGAALPWFHIIALVIPLLFTRIIITVRYAIEKKLSGKKTDIPDVEADKK